MSRELAEYAYDLHTGLSTHSVTDFDDLYTLGMAATLAIHIKGLGVIEYDVLRKVSDHFMSIPSTALEKILRLLSEIGFVRLTEVGRRIDRITPNIPVFDDVYDTLGSFAASELTLNSHEQATIQILKSLQNSPRNKDALFNALGAERDLLNRCLSIGSESGIVSQVQARGRSILISPFYFADNLEGLADAAAASGASAIESALKKVRSNQGWPLSLLESRGEIGGTKLSTTELALVSKLSAEGIIKPPTIKFGAKSESFVFTPKPGAGRLNAANREIYERAMALISAMRKGQLLPDQFKIRSPVSILEAFRARGFIAANSEAYDQYLNLVVLRVAHLHQATGDRWELRLNSTDENVAALNLAITLLKTGELSNMEVNQDAKIALSRGEEYVQSLISATELKRRKKQIKDEQANAEFEQLILKFD